jgi:hypothetical protein
VAVAADLVNLGIEILSGPNPLPQLRPPVATIAASLAGAQRAP